MFSQLVGVLLCSVVGVLAAPAGTEVVPLEKQQPTVIPIVSQSEELESNGTYKFSYETANGIKREEISFDKVLPKVEGRSGGNGEGNDSDESNEIHVQQGSYSYTAPDGTVISLSYIADENGFRPVGDHLPKAPALTQQLQAKSNEKSGRALDNAESGSSPAAVAAKVVEPAKVESRTGLDESKPPATKTAEEPAPTTAATDKAVVTEVTSTSAVQSSSKVVSTAAPELTTEAASTLAPNEVTSTPSPASSEASTQTAGPTTTA